MVMQSLEFEDQEMDVSTMTVAELRSHLKEKGLSTKGSKKILAKRLKEALEDEESCSTSDTESEADEKSPVEKVNNTHNNQSKKQNSSSKSSSKASDHLDLIRKKEILLKMDIEAVTKVILEINKGFSDEIIKMENRLQKLVEYREKLKNIKEDIIELVSDSKIEEEATKWIEYEQAVDNTIDLAQEYLLKRSSKHSDNQSIKTGSDYKQSNLKLPKLELPKFYGDVLKFQNFWDQFEAAVHNNEDLPDVQKFTYLRSVLGGVAYQTIEGFEVTGVNYHHAVESLKHRYGRKRIVVSSLVKSVIKLETKSSMDVTTLRDLHDTLKNRIRALEALGEDPRLHSSILLPVFEMKLPSDLCEKWELELTDMEDDKIDLDLFFKFLNRQVVSKEAGQRSAKLNDQRQSGTTNRRKPVFEEKRTVSTGNRNREATHTSSSLLSEVEQKTSTACDLCQTAGHVNTECPELKRKSVTDRWEFVKENKLCFNCLKPTNSNHYSMICRHPRCKIDGCNQRHHELLHKRNAQEPETQTKKTFNGFAASKDDDPKQILLQTTIATLVVDNQQKIPVRVLFDSGSQRSYVTEKLAEAIGLQGPTEVLSVSTFGGVSSQTKKMKRVQLSIAAADGIGTAKSVDMEALTINKICNPLDPVNIDFERNTHLKGLKLADSYPRGSAKIDVLIGADYYYSFISGECRKGSSPDSLTAVKSTLGWIVSGAVNGKQSTQTTSLISSVRIDPVAEGLKKFWELESIGIHDHGENRASPEEEDALLQFKEGLKFDGERYVAPIPWKRDHPKLKNNYQQAVKRLESTERQLKRNPEKAEAYKNAINQYVERGYAEEVTEKDEPNALVRYLPHHGVFREDKSTSKCRVVFDASARESEDDVSLNDCVLPGPALQSNLVSVLLRFRLHKIALMADIEKMFLQVGIPRRDQDVHRYLWRDLCPNEVPKIYRMLRLTFGVSCSPFLAMATVQHHAREFEELYPEASKEVLQNMYVDDCLTGADDEDQALELQQSLTEMMSRAAFNLTKWSSNSEDVLKHIDEKDRAPSKLISLTEKEPLKALGICWETDTDCFKIRIAQRLLDKDAESKRSLLSIASTIYDPMGLLTPFTIRAKLLFQQLWQRGLEWDDELPTDVKEEWRCWKSELHHLNSISIPRCIVQTKGTIASVEVHGFGDASPKAYGAAVYLRVTDNQGCVSTQLVMSKSRVAPTKMVSLPRLELLAAVLNSRLLKFVVQSLPLKFERVVAWTDSEVALYWIKGVSSQWKTFVSNRVVEIQSLWDPQLWKHCPGVDNPADLVTRGLQAQSLGENILWSKGPEWLSHPEESWPKQKFNDAPLESVQDERKSKEVQTLAVVADKSVIDHTRYGKWSKLVRVTAYVFRSIEMFKSKKQVFPEGLSSDEITHAELYWYRQLQKEVYSEEFAVLRNNQPVSRQSRLLKLDPYFDEVDQVVRVGGRLQYSEDLPEHTKHPIILPHGHHVTERIIRHVHQELLHAGPEMTLSVLRQKIWLTQGRRDIKRVLRRCVICQKQAVGPCSQKMAPLPPERVSFSPAFTHVGVDFAGPLYVQGKSPKKAYVCLFTCLSSRMVHLELTNDLSTAEFLQAFLRMISRRGLCDTIWSDNAKTFKSANRKIQRLYSPTSAESERLWNQVNQQELKTKLASKGVKWKFITERSPWRGGIWERLVRSVKVPLRKVLGKAFLSFTELNTVLIRVEAVINARPLTAVSDDVRDSTPITPAHLALGRPLLDLPDMKENQNKESKTIQRFLYQQKLLNHFWKRWRNEYLHPLTVRKKWNKEEVTVKVGDIVLIAEDNVSRNKWNLGRIENLHPGKDGLIRTVTLRTQRGTLNRPVQRLHRLEVDAETPSTSSSVRSAVGPSSRCGEPELKSTKKKKEKKRKERRNKEPKSPKTDVLQRRCRSGEDVPARTRSGRTVRKPKRLDL